MVVEAWPTGRHTGLPCFNLLVGACSFTDLSAPNCQVLPVMDPQNQHTRQVVDQFSRQAVYFAKLPGHEEATQLLLRMAGVTATDHVLDVACGAGAVACAAARVARRVTGIDLTPAMIERAAALQAELGLANIAWHVGDVTRLPSPADQFDVVLTRYSLHHFLQPAEVLKEMARVCKPSGHIAVA